MTRDTEPSAPQAWSFSALRDARECPRRWALRASGQEPVARAMGRSGAAPGMGLVRGHVCHAALERMLDAHREGAGPAWGDPALQAFWKRHFTRGIVGIVREEAERELRRAASRHDAAFEARLRREVDEAVPSLAATVGVLLRLTLSRAGGSVCPVVFAEVHVESEMAPGVRWRGRIDAVVRCGADVTLIDYKTGAPSPYDVEQLTAYACMFERDERTRGWGTVRRLAVLYGRGDMEERDAPAGEALDAERARLARESLDTARRLLASPPEASPEPQRCLRCDVRGRCDAYWSVRATWGESRRQGVLTIDAELSVLQVLGGGRALRAKGDGGVWFVGLGPEHQETAKDLAIGVRVRVVGARTARPEELDKEMDKGPPVDIFVDLSDGGLLVSCA